MTSRSPFEMNWPLVVEMSLTIFEILMVGCVILDSCNTRHTSKPSLKIRTANPIFWIFLCGTAWKIFFLGIKLFLFFMIASWDFQHLFEIEFFETSQNSNSFSLFRQLLFSFFYRFSDWVEILHCFTKFFSNQILKVSAFYLEKQKSFSPKKIKLLSISKQKSFVYRPNFHWRFWHNWPRPILETFRVPFKKCYQCVLSIHNLSNKHIRHFL